MSPATMPWFVGADGDGGLAGEHAGAGLDAGAQRADRVDQLQRRPGRPARRRPRARSGAPQTAITASPMNFSTVPPYWPMTSLREVEVAGQGLADVLRVARRRERREAHEVGEQDR